MHPDFWQQRWRDGRIGFHQERVTPLLEQHWDAIGVPAGARVFVPLAGKSLDMLWLASRGYRVLGVEVSGIAVAQFFAENGLSPAVTDTACGLHHDAGAVEIIQGDVFGLDARTLASCDAVYDRAALIALPRSMRTPYVQELHAKLPSGCRGLLVALDYPPDERHGPPFPVDAGEVHRLYDRDWDVELLERRDILASQPGFIAEGVSALHTTAWRIRRR
jgi:thiopurine S-methyltransferase